MLIFVSIIDEAAPGYLVSIVISDFSTSGNCLSGSSKRLKIPKIIKKKHKTMQKTGFLIKKIEKFILFLS